MRRIEKKKARLKPVEDTITPSYKLDKDRRFINRMAIRDTDKLGHIAIGIRRAYILPTHKGLYYVITLAVMFLWSINFGLSLGYALTFFTAVFALIVAVLTVKNLTGIEVIPLANNYFFAGELAYFRIKIRTQNHEPKVQIQARRNGRLTTASTTTAEHDAIYQIPLGDSERGVHSLDYLQLRTDYPIGIFRSWTWVHFDATVMIYPQPLGSLALPYWDKDDGKQRGESASQGAEDFLALRDYHTGDSVRHIVWKKISQGTVRIKTFNELSGEKCVLDFNNSVLLDLNSEQRLSQLCQWVLDANKLGLAYELVLPKQTIKMGQGANHRASCLAALACY